MAWIEAVNGSYVNLDNVECLDVDYKVFTNPFMLTAVGNVTTHVLAYVGECNKTAVLNAAKQIAGLARGNALITQDDIQKIITEAGGNAEQ